MKQIEVPAVFPRCPLWSVPWLLWWKLHLGRQPLRQDSVPVLLAGGERHLSGGPRDDEVMVMVPCPAFCLTPQPKHTSSVPTPYSRPTGRPTHSSEPAPPPAPVPLTALLCQNEDSHCALCPQDLAPGRTQPGEMTSPSPPPTPHFLSNHLVHQEPGPP